jgi:IS1 family transposase
MKCIYCNKKHCIKKGVRNNKQRYQCKSCKKYQLKEYTYKLYNKKDDSIIIALNAESIGISSLSRFLGYSKQTILKRISYLASKVTKPKLYEYHQVYEVDEMWTYVSGCKERDVKWITYAINRATSQVIDVVIGSRNKENLAKIINQLKLLSPQKIITDKLAIYPKLVSPIKHDTRRYNNNKIERSNLNLRTHLKRLSRKTICYSKSEKMLENCLLLYFYWNNWQMKFSR